MRGDKHVRRWGGTTQSAARCIWPEQCTFVDGGTTQSAARSIWPEHSTTRARADLELACKLAESVPDYHALALAPGNLGLVMIEQGVREALVRSPRRPLVQQARR
jgi:hypothetical protein